MKKHYIFRLPKATLAIILLSFLSLAASAQIAPSIGWDKTIGGNNWDLDPKFEMGLNGDYFIGGASASNIGGDKSENNKSLETYDVDFWVLKFDAAGNKLWDKTIGGSVNERISVIHHTPDGGCLLVGYSNSETNSGDRTALHRGATDYWVVKLDANGNKEWDKAFGGSFYDDLYDMKPTTDGGYILAGTSRSAAGYDKSENGGYLSYYYTMLVSEPHYWVIKTDANFNKIWDKSIKAGPNGAFATSVLQTPDGGYLIGGYATGLAAGDKSQDSYGSDDFWLVKLDTNGNKEWDKTIGSSGTDWLTKMIPTEDGNYILAGSSIGPVSGDKTMASKGDFDYWVVKIDPLGNKIWDKVIGGSNSDLLSSALEPADGGLIVIGRSQSGISGDKTENKRGGEDYWVVKLDDSGNIEWDKTIGSNYPSSPTDIFQTPSGGYILSGQSTGNASWEKSENSKGSYDYWIVYLNCNYQLDSLPNTISPLSQTVCAMGTPGVITGSNDNSLSTDHVTYQWQKSFDNMVWSDVPGGVLKDLSPEETNATTYFRRIANWNCDHSDTSNVHTLNIGPNTAPTVDAGPAGLHYCPGGSVTLGGSPTASGGTAPYNYLWNNAPTLNDATVANPIATPGPNGGTYNVTVTDALGCITIRQTQVFEISANAGPDQTICEGNSAQIGTPKLSGEPPVHYQWSLISGNGLPAVDTTAQIIVTPTVNSVYQVQITGPGGCPNTDQVQVSVTPAPVANAGADQTLCKGSTVTLGTPAVAGYKYFWQVLGGGWSYLNNDTIAQPVFSSVSVPGNSVTYVLTVIDDAYQCTAATDTVTLFIIKAEAGNFGIIPCGPVQLGTPSQGAGYTYLWSVLSGDAGSLAGQENNPQITVNPNTLTTYQLSVSFNGVTCTDTQQVNAYGQCHPCGSSSTINVPATCNNGNLLQSLPFPIGYSEDTTLIRIQWTGDSIHLLSAVNLPMVQVTDTVRSVLTFNRIVTDISGNVLCTVAFTLAPPAQVAYPIIDETEVVKCFNTPGIVIGDAPVSGFTYQWSPAAGLSNPDMSNPVANPAITTTYILQVTHIASGCSKTFTKTVKVIGSPAISAGQDQSFCGQAIFTFGSPAQAGWAYSWVPAAGLTDPTSSIQTDTAYSNLVYILTATDTLSGLGCTVIDTVYFTEINTVTADAGPGGTICALNSIQLGTTDSTAYGYTYHWVPAAGLSNPTSPTPMASPSQTTTYTLIVENGGIGCAGSSTATVVVTPPGNLGLSPLSDEQICKGKNIQIGPAPVAGYVYSWSPATGLSCADCAQPLASPNSTTTYTLYVRDTVNCLADTLTVHLTVAPEGDLGLAPLSDVNFCEGSSIQIGPDPVAGYIYSWSPVTGLSCTDCAQPLASPLTNTTYTLYVRDTVNCLADTLTVHLTVTPNGDLGLAPLSDVNFCEGSSIQIGPAPVAGYVYSWSPATGLSCTDCAQPLASPADTTTYTLMVTDSANCLSDTLTIQVSPISLPSLPVTSYAICTGDSVALDINEVAGYTYSWSPATNLSCTNCAEPIANPTATTTYTLTATNGTCSFTFTGSITVNVNPLPVANAGPDVQVCNTAVAIGSAPVAGMTYLWSPVTGLSNPNIANPTALPTVITSYVVKVINNTTGCINYDTVVVSPNIEINFPQNLTICPGGSVQIGPAPIAGYTYSWSPATGLSNATIANPVASPASTRTYTLTINNGAGCIKTRSVVITVTATPQLSASGPSMLCQGSCGTLTGTVISGTFTNFYWTPATGISNPNSLVTDVCPTVTTTYTLTGVTTGGCTASAQVLVMVATSPPPVADAGPDMVYVCEGESVQLGTPAVAGLLYVWSPVAGLSNAYVAQPTFTPYSAATSYSFDLTVTDLANGCTGTDHIVVMPKALQVDAGADQVICQNDPVTLYTSISGSVGQVQYQWSPATGLSCTSCASPEANPAGTTEYTVMVTDPVTGCTATDQVVVSRSTATPPQVNLYDVNFCTDYLDVQVDLTPVPGYVYSWEIQYPWYGATISDASIANPVINTGTDDFLAILTVTDPANGGCNMAVDTMRFTKVAPPTAFLEDKVLCDGNNTVVIGPDMANTALYTYQWYPSAGLSSSTVPNPTATVSQTTGYTLQVSYRDLPGVRHEGGCQSVSAMQVIVEPPVYANAGPDVVFTPSNMAPVILGTSPIYPEKYQAIKPATDVPISTDYSDITSSIVVNANGALVDDVNVLGLDLTTEYDCVYQIVLESPSGTQVTLLDMFSLSCDPDILISFDDQAASSSYPSPATDGLAYRPVEPLSAFNGEPADGVWKLHILNPYGYPNTLSHWNLEITGASSYQWSPSTGLSDTAVAQPYVVYTGQDVEYVLTVTTPAGCTATDTVLVSYAEIADLQISKTDGSPTYIPGTTTTYTVVVTNAGPSDVTGATVTDNIPSGTTWSYTASASGGATGFSASGTGNILDVVNMPVGSSITYTVTLTTPSNFTGNLVNTATVTLPAGYMDPTPADNTATDTDTYTGNPQITLYKEGTWNDTNMDGFAQPGDTITYTFTVVNTGNVTVSNLVIEDLRLRYPRNNVNLALAVTPSSLAPGEQGTATATYVVTQLDIDFGSKTNDALATGTDPNGDPLDDIRSEDPTPLDPNDPFYDHNCPKCTITLLPQNPQITLLKEGTWNDTDLDGIAQEGETISYSFTVTNTGNVTVSNLVIDDPVLGVANLAVTPSGLAPGEQGTATATYTVTQADIDSAGVYNIATATGIYAAPFFNTSYPVTDVSEDPTPLDPNDPNYDPNCPDCTFTPLTPPTQSCGCVSPMVTLDATTCTFTLTADIVLKGVNCQNLTIRVADSNPLNGPVIDCAGEFTYGVFDDQGVLICWGKVVAEDKSGPLYLGFDTECKASPDTLHAEKDLTTTSTDSTYIDASGWMTNTTAFFLCLDAEDIFNKENTWTTKTDRLFAGKPIFGDACHNSYCQCNTTLKATDQITYFTCDEMLQIAGMPSGYQAWARIKRTFTATDCYGNTTQGWQYIYLIRPTPTTFANQLLASLQAQTAACNGVSGAYDPVKDNCCGEVDYELDLACLVGGDKCAAPSAEEMLRLFKTRLYVDNALDCNNTTRKYAFFQDAVNGDTKLLGCNYSFDAKVVNTFPVCGNGKKVLVKLSYFDWCTSSAEHGLENCTYVLLKWYDNEAPEFADVRKVQYNEPARFCQDDFALEQRIPVSEISTGAMDCTAALSIDAQGLKEYLGWEITDNCDETPSVSVTRMERWGLQYAYGIPLGSDSCWHEETYQVMVVGGRPVVAGLAPGLYRFTVEAFDHCYNKADSVLYIRVVDKIAPVMKCDDQLNITLSNSQGSAYGQGYPAAGTGIYGYARVLAKDVDEGSWDNCGMDRIKIRRSYDAACQADFIAKGYDWDNNGKIEAGKDGIDENKDGSLSANEKFESVTRGGVATVMTPWLDYAEFFCCDLGKKVIVELGGWDKTGNFNYCWSEQLIEDKVLPTYILPWPVTIKCTDRAYVEGLMTAAGNADGWDVTGDEYKNFVEKVLTDKGGVQNVLVTMSGNDCRNTAVKAKVTTDLHCEAGTVTVTYSYTKTTSKGTVTNTIGSVAITVQPVHEYNIMFPADLEGDCVNIRDTANVIDGGELSCDVLAVNVSDKRYNGATLNGAPIAECYKIFRTFTVINWCQYDERCGEPMQWAVVVPRDPNNNGTNWNDGGGVNVLVRDKDMDRVEEIYYEDEDGNVAYPADAVNWANKGGKTVSNDDKVPTGLPAACEYASYGNNGSERFAWMFTQYIFVHDKVRPVVLDPAAFTFYQNKNNCNTTVSIEFSAEDLCSTNTEVQQVPAVAGNLAIERVRFNGGELPSWLTVAPAHKLNGDDKGTNSWVVSGTGTSAQAPIGDHKLTVIVRDDCGNLSLAKDIPFSIKDTNGIAPICYHGLSTDLMKNPDNGKGEMVIWATDFKASDVQDCNAKTVGTKENIPDAQYYVVKDSGPDGIADGVWDSHDGLNEAGIPTSPQTSVTFTCADAKVTQVAVRLYTKDALGNWAWCETYAIVTDARKVCPSAAASAAIGGAIATENKESVEGVEVALSGHSSLTKVTNNAGEFGFSGVTLGYDYTVTPHLDKNALNGVSTFDLVLITKHILGVQPLNSPYKLIAADVNNSKSVTTLDLIQLRKLILGIDTKFANNTSWRFVDRSFKFADPANPWKTQFPEVANLNDLAADAKADFVAVKVGDVNGNAIANTIVRTAGAFNLKVEDQPLKAGNEYRIPFTGDVSQIEGYQFTLNYGQSLELVDIEYGVAKAENFGVFEREGLITASWNEAQGAGRKAQGETLFTLVVKAKADVASLSEVLNINSRITRAEAYRAGGDYLNVDLAIQPLNHLATQSLGFALNQNTPNPFSGETMIGFTLPQASEATLTIQDATGRTLRVVKGQFAQGNNQVILKSSELNGKGVLMYTLRSGGYSASKRMIILE